MGFLDMLGITKRVNETDVIRKKEEIDALYAEMLTITDNLTKTAQKIKDLKDQINKLPPADDKKEADSDNNKVENSNSNNISEPQPETEPKPETESEPIKDDAQENEVQSLVENAAPDIQQGSENVLANPAPQQTVQPLFGTGRTTTTAPMYNPNGVMNNNNNIPPQSMQTQQIQQPYGQQMSRMPQMQTQPIDNNRFNLQNSDLQSSDGGKKKRKTKSATSLKRKRRTRRNKKAGAEAAAAAPALAAAEAATET